MKKIAVYFSQAGGANAIIPLMRQLESDYDIIVSGRSGVREYISQDWGKLWDIQNMKWETEAPDVLITDTTDFRINPEGIVCRELWERAAAHNVPSIAYVDSWWAYTERFCLSGETPSAVPLPNYIAAVDDRVRDALIDRGFPSERIIVTGSPRLAQIAAQKHITDDERHARRCRLGLEDDDIVILFVSQPLEKIRAKMGEDWGFTEKSILESVFKVLENLPDSTRKKVIVMIAPHPEEDVAELSSFLENKGLSSRVEICTKQNLAVVLSISDLVAGMYSIFLSEAVLMGYPVISIQLNLKKKDILITDIVGATMSITKEEELGTVFVKALTDKCFRGHMVNLGRKYTVIEDAFLRWKKLIKSSTTTLRLA